MAAETILITGGAGNLARQLAGKLAAAGSRVVLVDLADEPPAGSTGFAYVGADVTEPGRLEVILRQEHPDVVLHFASLLSGASEADRSRAWRVNVDGAFLLFEAAVAAGVPRVFFPSSVAAYGAPLPDPVPIDQPQWPTGLYGVTKAAIERLGVYYHHHHGLDFRCIRLPIVVSRFAPAGAASAYASRSFVETVERGGYTFRVRPTTSPSVVYIKDALAAIVALVHAPPDALTRRVYNIQALSPSAKAISDAILARRPEARLEFDPDLGVAALIDGWPVHFDDAAARSDWGWEPLYDLERLADDFMAELADGPDDRPGVPGTR